MTRDDFKELIQARIEDIDGPDLTQSDVINAAADACVEAMGRVRRRAAAEALGLMSDADDDDRWPGGLTEAMASVRSHFGLWDDADAAQTEDATADTLTRLASERAALAEEVLHGREIVSALLNEGRGTGKSLTAWCEDAEAWLAHVEEAEA